MQDVEDFIKLHNSISEKYPEYSGGCLKFAMLLIMAFKRYDWQLYYDGNHIITKLYRKPFQGFFDVTGKLSPDNQYKPVTNNFDLVYQFRDVLSKEEFKLALELLCKEEK